MTYPLCKCKISFGRFLLSRSTVATAVARGNKNCGAPIFIRDVWVDFEDNTKLCFEDSAFMYSAMIRDYQNRKIISAISRNGSVRINNLDELKKISEYKVTEWGPINFVRHYSTHIDLAITTKCVKTD